MRRLALALALIPLLAGCQKSAEPGKTPAGAAASASAVPAAPPAPPVSSAEARKVSEKTDLYEFAYSYPAAAAGLPALRDWLEADLARNKADLANEAKEAAKDAKAEAMSFNAYESETEWQVVTDLPGWLSLSAQTYLFTGGVHGNTAFQTILWDKAAGKRRSVIDLFTSPAALKRAVQGPFCAALGKERAKRREGDEVWDDPDDPFVKCIDPLEEVVILGSKGRTGFDRIGFLIAPYDAGPYAEGTYEVTLSVTPAVLAAVKPEYKAAFVAP